MKEFISAIKNVERYLDDGCNDIAVVLWHSINPGCHGVDIFYGSNVKRFPKRAKENFDNFIDKVNEAADLLASKAKCKFVLVDSYTAPDSVGELWKNR